MVCVSVRCCVMLQAGFYGPLLPKKPLFTPSPPLSTVMVFSHWNMMHVRIAKRHQYYDIMHNAVLCNKSPVKTQRWRFSSFKKPRLTFYVMYTKLHKQKSSFQCKLKISYYLFSKTYVCVDWSLAWDRGGRGGEGGGLSWRRRAYGYRRAESSGAGCQSCVCRATHPVGAGLWGETQKAWIHSMDSNTLHDFKEWKTFFS